MGLIPYDGEDNLKSKRMYIIIIITIIIIIIITFFFSLVFSPQELFLPRAIKNCYNDDDDDMTMYKVP